MAKLCAFVWAVLWASGAQAVQVYLDDAFTFQAGSPAIGASLDTLAAEANGDVYAARLGQGYLFYLASGANDTQSYPAPSGVLLGHFASSGPGQLVVGTFNEPTGARLFNFSGGNFSHFATLPVNHSTVRDLSVSPITGNIVLRANGVSGERLMSYSSSGSLLWNVAGDQAKPGYFAFAPNGDLYLIGQLGAISLVDQNTGELTPLPTTFPEDVLGFGVGFVMSAAFSSSGDLYVSTAQSGNFATLGRIDLLTSEWEKLVAWEGEIPLPDRDIAFAGTGDDEFLAIPAFDVEPAEFAAFGSMSSLNSDPEGLPGIDVLLGDFGGEFAGFSSGDLLPEPSSVWLLLGLLVWKRKKLGLRYPPLCSGKR